MNRGPFEEGESVLLVDHRGRRYLLHLRTGQKWHYHNGIVAHDELIGMEPGTTFHSTQGGRLRAYRPTLGDFVLKMPRRATVSYPKDIGPILFKADVFPGARVLEAGVGSGALSLALLRAVGPVGQLVSYELREDHADAARANIQRFCGGAPANHEIRLGDVAGVPEAGFFDRVVLDLPEPWATVPDVARALAPGGLWLSYVPTVPQVEKTVAALREHGFARLETSETLERTWNVEGASVRPDHRMVAHTGFLTTAVRLA